MDRISTGNPIVEISDLYYFYVVLGMEDPSVIEKFMGFSYQTAIEFFDSFLKYYMNTEDKQKLEEAKEKASLLCYSRMIRKLRKSGTPSEKDKALIKTFTEKLKVLAAKLSTLELI